MNDHVVTTDEGDRIKCPHCGAYHKDLSDHEWTWDEDQSFEVECGNCSKTFSLRRIITVNYEAKAIP